MLVALSGDGMLLTFSAEHPGDARTTTPSGVSGQLIGLDRLVRQEPPNDGTLRTIGPLGVHVPPEAGFEIVTDGEGKNRGLAAFASTLYDVDLATGAATSLGTIGGPSGSIVGLSTIAEKP